MIDDIVNRIANTILVQGRDFQNPDGSQMSIDISEFYEVVETRRMSRLDVLVQDYNSIGESFLMKVEEVVAKTATGHSPVLAGYYHYWERNVYNAIAQMAIRSMAALMGLLQCKDSPPLFKVIVALNGNDMIVSPALPEVDKLLTKAVRNMAESAKLFVRWMYGTSIKAEPQIINEDEEPYVFSFFQDISKNPQVRQYHSFFDHVALYSLTVSRFFSPSSQVVKLTLSLTSQTNKVYNMTNKYLDGWRRYDKVTGLWNPKRKQQIEKLRPTCANLDSAMNYFQGIKVPSILLLIITAPLACCDDMCTASLTRASSRCPSQSQETVESQPVSKDIDFLQIDMTLVAAGVAKQCEIWKNDYGEVLLNTSHQILTKLQEKMTKLEAEIISETADLEQLKYVLNVIAEVQQMTQDVELEMLDINERYRTLKRYAIEVPEDEMTAALTLDERWRQLYCDSRTRDLRLVDTKDQFRTVTAQQDVVFREQVADLRKNFLDGGPGVSSVSLDEGMELLAEYKLKVAKLQRTKAELINAQNLFDLDVKPYPALQSTQTELEQLEKIYALYKEYKEFQESMSSTLWGDLDISALQRGAEDMEKAAKRFPKELKELPTFKTVEARLISFKESLPLVVNLKNDAMKIRHWQKLQEVTGVMFDVTLKTLTLSNIFAMDLGRFTAQVRFHPP
jgi:dynein heavy chain